ncbi:triple tyrosine motif-containing protein [Pedobacter sp. ASV1-7]|uniref:helix-turn-helix and ligand-binding sensor domain-containing protein n=1 Tax=Pedobacter sp. ASV1-7 TaxID=3145237 RepID=UPI0032E889A0
MKNLLLIVLINFSVSILRAQNPIGLPQIVNYSNTTYKGGIQNWDIQQDKSGIMYFANNEGLLTFNGRYWKLYPLPNKTIIRSLKIDTGGRIYVGGQDEFGYFYPDQNGVLKYTSLKPLIPAKYRQFSDIWDIVILKDQVFFRTVEKIFQLKDKAIKVYPSNEIWDFIGKVNDQLYAQIRGKGLFWFKNGAWQIINEDSNLKYNTITAILNYDAETTLITTLKSGIFLLKDHVLTKKATNADNIFKNDRIFCAIQLNNEQFALGTTSAACIIIDKNGNVLQKFSYDEGLQKNNIRSLFIDYDQNLWLGLDDGIDFVAYNSPVKQIFPDKNKQVTGYSTRIFDKTLYLGTSNGLFYSPLSPGIKDISYSKNYFQEVKNTKGQVWSLNEINQKLLLGHEDGAFIIEKNNGIPIYSNIGTWLFEAVSSLYPSSGIISGTYNGLHSIEFSNSKFTDKGTISGLSEPLRFVHYDQSSNTVWASHPYRGVYKLELSSDRKKIIKQHLFTKKEGLPSTLNNFVFHIKNRIVIATEKGIYEYLPQKNEFIPSDFFKSVFKNNPLQYLKEDNDGNIWFVSNNEIGVVDYQNATKKTPFTIVHFPELNSKLVAGFENIYPYDEENIFVGANKGIYHINYLKYTHNVKKLNVLLTEVTLFGKKDSIIYGGHTSGNIDAIPVKIKNSLNSLRFEFSSTLFEQQNNIEFSYQLEGFDKNWSDWSAKSEKDYTNLPYGTFSFKVKSRNNLGSETSPVTYTFTILPAWYQTNIAFVIYFLLIVIFLYLLIKWQAKKHIKAQQQLKKLHQLDIKKSESEIIQLKNEKLESEVNFKNKELAITTMHLAQRGKLLLRIKEDLYALQKPEGNEKNSEKIKSLLKLLDETEKSDNDWSQFSLHFDQVHNNFLGTLKQKFPHLSQNDLKMSAYLKMNLSSKEIAQLLGITIRGVEVGRYRLRKKLNLSSEVNLFDYLLQVTNLK